MQSWIDRYGPPQIADELRLLKNWMVAVAFLSLLGVVNLTFFVLKYLDLIGRYCKLHFQRLYWSHQATTVRRREG